ncbi:DUF302 domain-containing protein [Thermogymnomonas acidicola]|uniref:DUF302 domain-containing protein n=1 Tax=Thermogymnomonas acidicola TaxID=399579 RepID=UPI00094647BE|nr:DUF302 domain-containing protein [Thermogymnomonas acidicola]
MLDYTVTSPMDPDKAFGALSQRLREKGYVLLSYVEMHTILRKNFNSDFKPYYILNVCKPPQAAMELMTYNESMGMLLPCKITISQSGTGSRVSLVLVSEMEKAHLGGDGSLVRKYERELEEILDGLRGGN